jgi:NhaA family Na+:H+ antiporter
MDNSKSQSDDQFSSQAVKASLELPPALSKMPVRRLMRPLAAFLKIESASGILLVICTMAALAIANSPASHSWETFWHTDIRLVAGSWELGSSLTELINDGLMTIFFFVVGLEIKREIVEGELRSIKKAALPIIAALGGMLMPAAIYLLLQYGREGVHGWGIPIATDIAFAVGIMAVLGRSVPAGLKIFLLALAIVDDIGAILVIAFFYSEAIQPIALTLAVLGLAVVVGMNKLGVRSVTAYFIVGFGIWVAMYHSGIHPTIAGVVLGLMTPGRAPVSRKSLVTLLFAAIDRLDGSIDRPQVVNKLTEATRETVSPVARLETALHAWVAFAIMPVFALANAGVVLRSEAASHEVAWAVAAGLIVGKPLGIFLFGWLAVKSNFAELPKGVNWRRLFGAGCLGGIGFTMSLFIAGLALNSTLLDAGKIGTLVGSTVSAVVGYSILLVSLRSGKYDGLNP